MVTLKFHDAAAESLPRIAIIIAKAGGKWILCKNRARGRYELPGGHRESGESILETAKRELREETGAVEFTIRPVCAYSVIAPEDFGGEETFGMLYYAEVTALDPTLHHEIESILLADEPPQNWSYPLIYPRLIEEAQRRGFV